MIKIRINALLLVICLLLITATLGCINNETEEYMCSKTILLNVGENWSSEEGLEIKVTGALENPLYPDQTYASVQIYENGIQIHGDRWKPGEYFTVEKYNLNISLTTVKRNSVYGTEATFNITERC